jgi:hypothetical protein
MKECLEGDVPPVGRAAMGGDCDFCAYARQRTELTLAHVNGHSARKKTAPKRAKAS